MRTIELTNEGAKNLMNAVVMQAVMDYRRALYQYNTARGRGKKIEHRHMILDCELFFRKNISAYCDLDGEKVIEKLREDVRVSLRSMGIAMEVPN